MEWVHEFDRIPDVRKIRKFVDELVKSRVSAKSKQNGDNCHDCPEPDKLSFLQGIGFAPGHKGIGQGPESNQDYQNTCVLP